MNKQVPFFDYAKLWEKNKKDYLKIIDRVASTGGFILQKELSEFEIELSKFTGINYSVGVGNATDAMEIFLEAIGINKQDEIIISSHTMIATASAIKVAGGIPVPVDIGDDNLICCKSIENAITKNTVGIMPTQLNGRICNMDPIIKIAKKYNLFIVEDAAQALGAKFKGKHAGTFGLAACISFFPAKILGCFGDAGAILVNDKDLFHKIYQLHNHGRDIDGKIKSWGRNSRLDNIQAAILCHKFKYYDQVIERRRFIAKMYHERLNDLNQLQLPPPPCNTSNHFDVYQNYELTADYRDKLKNYLAENNIGTLIQWGGKGVHQFNQLGFSHKLPNTEKFFKRSIMLPMNIFISNEDVEYICETIRHFYKR